MTLNEAKELADEFIDYKEKKLYIPTDLYGKIKMSRLNNAMAEDDNLYKCVIAYIEDRINGE